MLPSGNHLFTLKPTQPMAGTAVTGQPARRPHTTQINTLLFPCQSRRPCDMLRHGEDAAASQNCSGQPSVRHHPWEGCHAVSHRHWHARLAMKQLQWGGRLAMRRVTHSQWDQLERQAAHPLLAEAAPPQRLLPRQPRPSPADTPCIFKTHKWRRCHVHVQCTPAWHHPVWPCLCRACNI